MWLERYFPRNNVYQVLIGLAVAFGYFESLLSLQDALLIQRESNRIKSLCALLDRVGQQEHLYEIFVDATDQVFSDLLEAVNQGVRDESFLVESFNNEYNSSAIITHFRVSLNLFTTGLLANIYIAPNKCVDEAQSSSVSGLSLNAPGPILRDADRNRQDRD